ncbi:MAG: hypothetical protein OXG35_28290 [Acidobacteria bacterium]|nr:hypothetical protein [Acidobacteriota bacterium]
MIWYRHWLELRTGLLVMAGLSLLIALTVTGPFRLLEFGQALTETRLGQTIGDRVLVWAEFAGRTPFYIFAATLALAGAGFDSLLRPSGAAVAYTLTLPVSRTRLICTRLAAALAATVLAGVLLSAAGAAVLLARGQGIPLVPVAQSLALGVPLAAALLAVVGALVTLVGYPWTWLAYFVLYLAAMLPVNYILAGPARGDAPWPSLIACLIVIPAAVAFTVRVAWVNEY